MRPHLGLKRIEHSWEINGVSDLLNGYWKSRAEIADALGVGFQKVRAMERAGMPYVQIRSLRLYPQDRIIAWLETHLKSADKVETAQQTGKAEVEMETVAL